MYTRTFTLVLAKFLTFFANNAASGMFNSASPSSSIFPLFSREMESMGDAGLLRAYEGFTRYCLVGTTRGCMWFTPKTKGSAGRMTL